MTEPIHIFIAYTRTDESYLRELRAQLKILERKKAVNIWYDGKLIAGQKWNEEIEKQLATSDIFLMLLSADFINSDYAYGKEMEHALKRHERGEAIIIPIIARDCAWELTPLAELQAPVQGKALSSVNIEERQSLYKGIVLDINKAVQKRQAELRNQQRYFADKKAWNNALKLRSINAYKHYLDQHPSGIYAGKAQEAIDSIKKQKEREKQAIEQKIWEVARNQNTIDSYKDYLQKYPNGRFNDDASSAIQVIEQKLLKQAQDTEREAFQKAKRINSITAYKDFLAKYPNSTHAKKAKRKVKQFEYLSEKYSSSGKIINKKRTKWLAVFLGMISFSIVVWQWSVVYIPDELQQDKKYVEEEVPEELPSSTDTLKASPVTPISTVQLSAAQQDILDRAISYINTTQRSIVEKSPNACSKIYDKSKLKNVVIDLSTLPPTNEVVEAMKSASNIFQNYYETGFSRRDYQFIIHDLSKENEKVVSTIAEKYGVTMDHIANCNPNNVVDNYQLNTNTGKIHLFMRK